MSTAPDSKVHSIMDELSRRNPHHVNIPTDDPEREELYDITPAGMEPIPKVSSKLVNRHAQPVMQVAGVQRVLYSLEYNHLPSTFFNLKKDRPLSRIIATAKEMLTESLPIRCLEATFLSIHLTQHLKDLHRIPLAFKSYCNGRFYRHIVLVVNHDGAYGALGLSRKSDLMDKPLCFRTLADLLDEFMNSYRANGHELVSFKLGLYVSHDSMSRTPPCFRFMTLAIPRGIDSLHSDAHLTTTLLRFQEMLPTLSEHYDIAPSNNTLGTSGAVNPGLAMSPKVSMPNDFNDMDDGNESDTEENRYRVQCVLQSKSPYQPSALAAKGTKAGAASKFASRLRSQVGGSGGSGGVQTTANVRTGREAAARQEGKAAGRRAITSCPPRARNSSDNHTGLRR